MLFNCGVGEESWESLGQQGEPVHPKGDQFWVGIGMTDVEAETPNFGHLMRRADSFEKTLMLGKIESGKRRGWQRMRWLDGITDSRTWVWVNSGSWLRQGGSGVLCFVGLQRVRHDWATELNCSIVSCLLDVMEYTAYVFQGFLWFQVLCLSL